MNSAKRAILFSIITAFLLSVLKISTGIYTGIFMLIASAADSLLDLMVSLFNYYAIYESEKTTDEEYNYGRGKILGIATLLESLIIASSGLYIIYNSIIRFIQFSPYEYFEYSIYTMIVSIWITFGLVFYLNKVYANTKNLIIQADALHYKIDLLTNLGMLISLGLIYWTGWKYVDPLISLITGIYILYNDIPLFQSSFHILMDRSLDKNVISKIHSILTQCDLSVKSYHQLRTRHSGNIIFIEFHLVFQKDILLSKAHEVSEQVELQIRNALANKCIINIHLDSYNDELKDLEQFKNS